MSHEYIVLDVHSYVYASDFCNFTYIRLYHAMVHGGTYSLVLRFLYTHLSTLGAHRENKENHLSSHLLELLLQPCNFKLQASCYVRRISNPGVLYTAATTLRKLLPPISDCNTVLGNVPRVEIHWESYFKIWGVSNWGRNSTVTGW
jgi:hypothetical protein